MSKNTIGQRLAEWRKEKGISQETMAKEFGLTQSPYRRKEKDDNVIKALDLPIFSKILGKSLNEIMYGTDKKP